MKTCNVCYITKSIDCFYVYKRNKDGYRNLCIDCFKAMANIYESNNKQKVVVRKRNYQRKRYHTDLEYRLRVSLRARLNRAIKSNQKSGSAVNDLGCSIVDLIKYLESKFTEGMTWDNYGIGINKWSIDHIVSLYSFDLSDRNQLIKACHYTNLQPMWFSNNSSKGSGIAMKSVLEKVSEKTEAEFPYIVVIRVENKKETFGFPIEESRRSFIEEMNKMDIECIYNVLE